MNGFELFIAVACGFAIVWLVTDTLRSCPCEACKDARFKQLIRETAPENA